MNKPRLEALAEHLETLTTESAGYALSLEEFRRDGFVMVPAYGGDMPVIPILYSNSTGCNRNNAIALFFDIPKDVSMAIFDKYLKGQPGHTAATTAAKIRSLLQEKENENDMAK